MKQPGKPAKGKKRPGTFEETPSQPPMHILVVEDEEAHAALIRRGFEAAVGKFRVSVAPTLADARRIIRDDPPALALVDWLLPDGKGAELLSMRGTAPAFPIIIMTSHGNEALAVKLMKKGAFDYLVKSDAMFAGITHTVERALREYEHISEHRRAEEALKKSQIQLTEAMDLAHLVNWEFDVATGIFTFDDRFYALYGTTAELEGGTKMPAEVYAREFVHPDDQYVVADEVNKAVQATDPGFVSQVEHRIIRRDGEIRHIVVRFGITKDANGRTIKTHGANQDITERKRMEETLRESEERLRIAQTNANIGIWDWYPKTGRIIWSPELERLYGLRPGTIRTYEDWRVLVHPEDLARSETERDEAIAQHRPFTLEFRIIHHGSGMVRWIAAPGKAVYDENGDVVRVSGINIDITERKQAERVLAENAARFRHISDLITDFAYSCRKAPDGPYIIDWLTGAIQKITGYTADEIHDLTCWRPLVIEDDLPVFDRDVIGLSPGESARYELRIRRKDGGIIWLASFAECIPDPEDLSFHRLYGGCRDITERKLADERLKRFSEELEVKVAERTKELSESLAEREILLREIHHRVKNNLQIITSLIRLQKRHISDIATVQNLTDSESRIRSMALVHEKLYRSTDLAHVDFADYIRMLASNLVNTYSVDPMRIRFRVEVKDLSIDINRAIPVGLIMNELISNALKHAFPNEKTGEITIIGGREADCMTLIIGDNGVGMPENFDWRNTTSLGLHLVVTLMQQVQGTIDMIQKGGTTFVLTIPAKRKGDA